MVGFQSSRRLYVIDFYKRKAEFHHAQWQQAVEEGKDKAAKKHMDEYINYNEMYEDCKKIKGN